MGAWMDKYLDEWTCILYDSLDGEMEARMRGYRLEWGNEFLGELIYVWLDGRMLVWRGAWMNGVLGGWI